MKPNLRYLVTAALFFCISLPVSGQTPPQTLPEPGKTAVIVIDMWNFHWCMTAAQRVAAMVPRMNAVFNEARKKGMLIIWNPSDVVTAYAGTPQYETAAAMHVLHPVKMGEWKRPQINVRFSAKVGPCLCGPGINCGGNWGWDAMNPDLKVDENDLFSASTGEIFSILKNKGIENVIYAGVHTNMCVFGKPGALSHLYPHGFNCYLARDLNDAFTNYDPARNYTPDDGTAEINKNLQDAGIGVINLGELLGVNDETTGMVRFAPWGKTDRPYFFDKAAAISLTKPFCGSGEIRYTTDGSEPKSDSALYEKPLKLEATTQIKAAVFADGKVSGKSDAYFVKLPPVPCKPDVYLDTMDYKVNEYLQGKNRTPCMWHPVKNQSYGDSGTDGKPLRIRGKNYEHGLGFRAPSGIFYDLTPEYKRFVGLAGIDEKLVGRNNGRAVAMHSSVIFSIYIDGQLAGESPVMRMSQEPWRFDIPIPPDSKRLSISCRNAGTVSTYDNGNLVDAGFVK
ncbi:MAG: isochorismatase family protein [Planctomycetaceae bacterium]|jgi:nicotinamidase-related amidase|nr:isochorismatase family protein [Planctomycetaceae bacterium]